jgi:hypothetical protein
MKKPGKSIELTTSAQIAAWRQRLDTETRICAHKNHTEIERMQDKLEQKNTYMHYFKQEDIRKADEEEEKNRMTVSNASPSSHSIVPVRHGQGRH